MHGRPIRLAAAVLVALGVALVAGWFLVTRDDDGAVAALPVRTADVRNGLPGLVTVERKGKRQMEVRPEWASFSRGAPKTGVAILLDVGGPLTFLFRAWSAPGHPDWRASAKPRAGRDVGVRALGTERVNGIVRPRGWTVEWSGGTGIERKASVSLQVAQSPLGRPWDVGRPAGDSLETSSSLGRCDDTSDQDECGRIPETPAGEGGAPLR